MEKNKYTTGFKIPEGYFETFDVRILDKLKEDNLPEDSGFTVPEGYFEAVEKKILAAETSSTWKVFKNDKQQSETPDKRTILYALAGIAAVLAIIVTLYPFGSATSYSFEDVNATSVSAYIQDGELDLSTEDYVMYLQDEDFDALLVSSEEISTENLSDYLFNNLDDTNLLYE